MPDANVSRLRHALADRLQRAADRLDPEGAEREAERRRGVTALGLYAYGSAAWSSVPTMLNAALERAAYEGRDSDAKWREVKRYAR